MKDFKGNVITIGDNILCILPHTHELVEGIVTGVGSFGRIKYKLLNVQYSSEYQSSPKAVFKLE